VTNEDRDAITMSLPDAYSMYVSLNDRARQEMLNALPDDCVEALQDYAASRAGTINLSNESGGLPVGDNGELSQRFGYSTEYNVKRATDSGMPPDERFGLLVRHFAPQGDAVAAAEMTSAGITPDEIHESAEARRSENAARLGWDDALSDGDRQKFSSLFDL
jgi:hypothetical protein